MLNIVCIECVLYFFPIFGSMRTKWTQSFYLDSSETRGSNFKQADGTYPIRIRVWAGHLGKPGMFSTYFYATKQDFEKSWLQKHPRGKNLELQTKLKEIERQVDDIFKDSSVYTMTQFKAALRPKPKKEVSVVVWDFMENQMLPDYSKKSTRISIKEGIKYVKNFKKNLTFYDFNVKTLEKFQKQMIDNGLSRSTANIYLRYLRRAFNVAIGSKLIGQSEYPFGRSNDGFFSISVVKTKKPSLTVEELEMLKHYKPEIKKRAPFNTLQKTIDLFLFSYYCGGANYGDIIKLKWDDIKDGEFTFRRTKTKDTQNEDITVQLSDSIKQIIKTWGVKKSKFVFGLISSEDKWFNSKGKQATKLNDRLRIIAKELNFRPIVQEKLSMVWARHTFATITDRKNYSLKQIGSLMGHASATTTENYIGSLKKEESLKMQNDL